MFLSTKDNVFVVHWVIEAHHIFEKATPTEDTLACKHLKNAKPFSYTTNARLSTLGLDHPNFAGVSISHQKPWNEPKFSNIAI